jgi:hypothetical protein
MSVKIVKLTALNVEALNRMAPQVTGLVEITKSTATFVGVTAGEAVRMVLKMQDLAGDAYGKTSGPYPALHAVRRKLETLVAAEITDQDRMRAESAKVEAMRDSGALTDGLAAARARSDARAEQDAANDPLMVLLNTTTPADESDVALLAETIGFTPDELDGAVRRRPDGGLVILAGKPESRTHAASISPVGARVHAALSDAMVARAVMTLVERSEAATVAMERFRAATRPTGRVAGRLLAASKTGQRRPNRSRRG